VLGAAACLTRLSALSFVAPALLWIVADAPRGGCRPLARGAATAGVVTMALIAPYLINCARETGDPFYAVNYHTVYYRAAEGLPGDPSVGAIEHIAQKLRARPVATIDTGAVGLFVFPFARKWGGFRAWWPPLEPLLRWLAACGLLLAVWSRAGRLLLVVIVMSLVPYALTWSVGGGGDWRFTQHVYPFYLVLGFGAVQTVWPAARALAARQVPARDAALALRRPRVIAFAAAGALAAAAYLAAPFFVVREALAAGEAASITSGPRDWPFFAGGWSDPSGGGNVVVRTAVAERAAVRLPLPGTRAYRLTLRMDPAETADPALQPRVTVFLDGRTIGQVRFQRDPQRVGTYRMAIPAELSGRLAARLDLVASHTVPASEAGLHFAWLPPATPVAFRLWYVRLEPE
jgi:hypothetical protein